MDTHIDDKRSKLAVGERGIKLSTEAKERLRKIPKTKCDLCNSKISYLNPMGRCFECKNRFCFDHLNCLQFKEGMSQNESLRDICDECKAKHGYRSL